MPRFAHIVVTTDLSVQALPAVEAAAGLARDLGSRLSVLLVVEDHLPPIIPGLSDEERQRILEQWSRKARPRLAAYAEEHAPGSGAEPVVLVGQPAREIVAWAQEHRADLVVMASHGFGPLRQVLLGSTTERVLHRAACPVLVVPSRTRAGTATPPPDRGSETV